MACCCPLLSRPAPSPLLVNEKKCKRDAEGSSKASGTLDAIRRRAYKVHKLLKDRVVWMRKRHGESLRMDSQCSLDSQCLTPQAGGHAETFRRASRGIRFIVKETLARERDVYEDLQNDPLRAYAPAYGGTRTFLESEVKSGKRRVDLAEKIIKLGGPCTDDERANGITKLKYMQFREQSSSTSTLGWRIEAIVKPPPADAPAGTGCTRLDTKALREPSEIHLMIGRFLGHRRNIGEALLQRLLELRESLEASPFFATHEFIGSSLLFVFDDAYTNVPKAAAKRFASAPSITMIDFAKTLPVHPGNLESFSHRTTWELGNQADGYLLGLDSLIETWKAVLQTDALFQPGVCAVEEVPVSALFTACLKGELQEVQKLHEQGMPLDGQDEDGRYPLHYAARAGQLEVVEWLYTQGALLDVVDKDGRSPIHDACGKGHLEVARCLHEHGVPLDVAATNGYQLIHTACNNGRLEVARWLQEHGVALSVAGNSGRRPVHYACIHGHLDCVKWLHEQGAALDVADDDGWLPIHHTCRKGMLDCTKWLHEQGGALDVADNDGWRPMHYACADGHLDCTRWLHEQGVPLDAPDIHEARDNGHSHVVAWLQAQGIAL